MLNTIPKLLSLALLLPTLGWTAAPLPIPEEQRQSLGIEVAAVVATDATLGLTATAKITLPPASVRVIAAPTDGLITSVLHQSGEQIANGQALITLSSPQLIEARRQSIQANLKHNLAADMAARDRKLFAEGLIAETRLTTSNNEASLAASDVEAARATLKLLGAKVEGKGAEITLTSPIEGTLIETLVEPGQRVDASTPLVKVGNLKQLGLEIPLSPEQANTIAIGQSVKLENSTVTGEIIALQPSLDAAQNVLVRAKLTQATDLRLGQSVNITILGKTDTKALSIPSAGLAWLGDKAYVFVENAQGFTPTPVNILNQTDTQVTLSGLTPNERVAVKGLAALKAKWQEAEE